MMDQNTCFAYLNMELPDDIRRLKEAGYYDAAIARIDACLAEDWTASQNQPLHPQGALPVNPTPHGVDAWRQGLLAHREILRRLPQDYTLTAEQLLNQLQATLRDFTAEEFAALDAAGQMDWRFVEGQKRYIYRAAETLVATHPDLAARQLDPPAPATLARERRRRIHDQMEREGQASARITLKTSVGMSDEAFAAALAKAKAEGRESVHVRAWLPIPAECLAQSEIELQSFTEQPGRIADANAPQRTVCWEADLTENRRFGVQYRYKTTAVYADPLDFVPAPEQPTFDTEEQAPHIVFTPYLRALAAQLTQGLTDPVQKAKRIYDFVTLNVHYHFQPMYFVHENITDNCARSRRGDCGVMAATFITLCRIAGIPAKWQSGMVARPETAGCHDWAMFYIAPKGWMYADCSAGASMARAGNEKMRLHYFGNLDTGRMVANRALCAPFDPPMCSFRADPCDNQVGEMEVDGVGLYGQQVETTHEIVKHQEV